MKRWIFLLIISIILIVTGIPNHTVIDRGSSIVNSVTFITGYRLIILTGLILLIISAYKLRKIKKSN